MTKPIARDPSYRRRVCDAEIIELCVRWYITYRLSYRDLVGMMAERGVTVAHRTILRWVTRYFLAHRRDVHFHSRQMALLVSSGRQTKERRSTFSFAVTAALRRHRRSFARRSPRIAIVARAR